jgi:hypothetical protein
LSCVKDVVELFLCPLKMNDDVDDDLFGVFAVVAGGTGKEGTTVDRTV